MCFPLPKRYQSACTLDLASLTECRLCQLQRRGKPRRMFSCSSPIRWRIRPEQTRTIALGFSLTKCCGGRGENAAVSWLPLESTFWFPALACYSRIYSAWSRSIVVKTVGFWQGEARKYVLSGYGQ